MTRPNRHLSYTGRRRNSNRHHGATYASGRFGRAAIVVDVGRQPKLFALGRDAGEYQCSNAAARAFRIASAVAEGNWSVSYAKSDLLYINTAGDAYLAYLEEKLEAQGGFLNGESQAQRDRRHAEAAAKAGHETDDTRSQSDTLSDAVDVEAAQNNGTAGAAYALFAFAEATYWSTSASALSASRSAQSDPSTRRGASLLDRMRWPRHWRTRAGPSGHSVSCGVLSRP